MMVLALTRRGSEFTSIESFIESILPAADVGVDDRVLLEVPQSPGTNSTKPELITI